MRAPAACAAMSPAAARTAASFDDFSQELIAASIAGANAWIETMPVRPLEYDFVGVDPEPYPTGEEGARYTTAIVSLMSWMLSANWDSELLRTGIAERLGWEAMLALFPDAGTEPSADDGA